MAERKGKQREADRRSGKPAGELSATRPTWKLTRNQQLLLLLVFVLALLVRCTYLWGQAQNNPTYNQPFMDAGMHHQWAQQIAAGVGLDEKPFFRAPLYYYVLALLYKLTGPGVTIGRLLGCLFGAVTCYLIARLGCELAGFGAGLLAGLLAVVYWPFIFFDSDLLTVALENLLNVAMLLVLLIAARRRSTLLFLIGGVLWGLSAITRPNVLALAPAIVVWLWIGAPAAGRIKHWLRSAVPTCVGAALAVLPVAIRNYVVGGEWVLVATNGGVNFYIGNNPRSNGYAAIVPGTRADWKGGYEDTHRIPQLELGRPLSEKEVSGYWYARAFEWIRTDPGAFLTHLVRKFRIFWAPFELPNNQPLMFFASYSAVSALFWVGFPLIACLGIAGVVLLPPDWRKWFLPIAFFLTYLATIVAFFCSGRYRVPVVPILILTSAAGLCHLPTLVRARRVGRLAAAALACLVGAALLATTPLDRESIREGAAAQGHHSVAVALAGLTSRTPADLERAIEHYHKAIELRPNLTMSRVELGRLLARLGRRAEAREYFAAAVSLNPNDAKSRFVYAGFLASIGENVAALQQYDAAIRLQPSYAEAHQWRGVLLVNMNRPAEAVPHLRTALGIEPDAVQARVWLGRALIDLGQVDAGVRELEPLLRRPPAGTEVSLGLADALRRAGRYAQASDVLKRAVAHAPDDSRLNGLLAWTLATSPDARVRDGELAVRLASHAAQLAGRPSVDVLDTLAAALAEAGRFQEAVQTAQQAAQLARRAGREQRVREIENRLNLYQQGRPFHETAPRR